MGGMCPCGKNSGKESKGLKELKAGKKPIFWIFGGPGSGKGTQCAKLAAKYSLVHLSSGDLLRAEVDSKSALGKELHELMLTGQLVSRQIVLDLLKKAMLDKLDEAKGYLIDGYPREVVQGKEFEEMIGPCSQIIYIAVSDEVMKSRLKKRGETSGRQDDNEATISNRIKVFHDVSEPVITEWASITTKISGEKEAETVFDEICTKIEPFLMPK